jgi:hypothetical protein
VKVEILLNYLHLLTPWSRDLDIIVLSWLVQKSPCIVEADDSFFLLITAHHWSVSCDRWNQAVSLFSLALRSSFVLFCHLYLFLPSGLYTQMCMHPHTHSHWHMRECVILLCSSACFCVDTIPSWYYVAALIMQIAHYVQHFIVFSSLCAFGNVFGGEWKCTVCAHKLFSILL